MPVQTSESFRLWLEGCRMNQTEIFRIAGEADNAVYKMTRQYECKHRFYTVNPVVYAVWVHGKGRLFTTNYKQAMKTWEEEKYEHVK